jgi:hypothetical protein
LSREIDKLAAKPRLSYSDSALFVVFKQMWRKDTPNNELIAAVERQKSFVGKMTDQLWIRSPALGGTLRRAVERYGRFLRLIKLYPGTMFVPTLDIDLAWHTHQLSHGRYFAATMERAGLYLDHDDRLGKATLEDGMERTKALYRIRFGTEYLVCTCWDCEAMLDAMEGMGEGANGGAVDAEKVADEVADVVEYHRAVELTRRSQIRLHAR